MCFNNVGMMDSRRYVWVMLTTDVIVTDLMLANPRTEVDMTVMTFVVDDTCPNDAELGSKS
jgi:hypothetical protein